MGTRTGQSILDRAWIKAQDQGINKRWDADEGLLWVNDWQLSVVNLLPRAYTQSAVVQPVAGTRQTLAGFGLAGGLQFVDIPHNVTAGGAPSTAMSKVKRAFLDERMRNWHQQAATEAEHWTTDEDDPKAAYVTPAITGPGKLRVIYSATPPDLTDLSQPIALDDVYAPSGDWFVLFCFYSKDITSVKSSQLAQMYYGLYERALGIRDQRLSMTEAKSNQNQQGA